MLELKTYSTVTELFATNDGIINVLMNGSVSYELWIKLFLMYIYCYVMVSVFSRLGCIEKEKPNLYNEPSNTYMFYWSITALSAFLFLLSTIFIAILLVTKFVFILPTVLVGLLVYGCFKLYVNIKQG